MLAQSSGPEAKAGEPERVAIVGSGCAGLAAAWALKDSGKDVYIFEKQEQLGGHTNTQSWHNAHGDNVPVDTGFIVLNTATYPNFIRFLQNVGVETVDTEMTFSVSRNHGEFEWSGEARGLFAQRRNLFRWQHWRMLFDIVRFNQFALDIIDDERVDVLESSRKERDMSIGDYLSKHNYSEAFRNDYLIPMTAAVWSTSPDKANLRFPARTLIRFLWNHHLLSTIASRPPWLTISKGSQRYVEAIINSYPSGRLHLRRSCEVKDIQRPSSLSGRDVRLTWYSSELQETFTGEFSHVIMACHGDQILPILSNNDRARGNETGPTSRTDSSHDNTVSQAEFDVFSAFETSANVCYLHSDLSLMPRNKKVWTSWNYLVNHDSSARIGGTEVSLTYNMNILQHIPRQKFGHVLVTMNPDTPPDEALTQGKFFYRHPLYTSESVRAQHKLRELQNTRRVSYCGAWTNYGFHEDAFSSGLRVAIEHLDAKIPFEFVDSTFSRGMKPVLGWKDYIVRAILILILWISNFVSYFLGLAYRNSLRFP